MAEFLKYHSIENHYNVKVVRSFVDQFNDHEYVALAKIDGANFSIMWDKDNPKYQFAKRSSLIGPTEKFFNVHSVMDKLNPIFSQIQEYYNSRIKDGGSLRVFGELYGSGVQSRIKYRDDQSIVFYDVVINGETIPWAEIAFDFKTMCISEYLVPVMYESDSLINALKVDIEPLNDKLAVYADQLIEGVIIRPKHSEFYEAENGRVIVKYKTQKFAEISSAKKVVGIKDYTISATEEALIELANTYINDNRVCSVLSKFSDDEKDRKNIGNLVKALMNDVIEELVKLEDPVYLENANSFPKVITKIAFKTMIKHI